MSILNAVTYAKTKNGTWYACSLTEYYLPRPQIQRRTLLYPNPELRAKHDAERLTPTVKKCHIGWTVDGHWCRTEAIRDSELQIAREHREEQYPWLTQEPSENIPPKPQLTTQPA